MRRLFVAMAAVIVAVGAPDVPAAAQPEPRFERVRPLDERAGRLLVEAWRSSQTVRELVEVLGASDRIVHVEVQPFREEVRGHVHLVNAPRGFRYVRVEVGARGWRCQRIAALAHELQHAVEVARAPEVRDEDALKALFRQVGWCTGGAVFETEAAQKVERRVRLEVITAAGRRR